MAFPDLTLRVDTRRPEGVAQLWAEATGVPANGVNLIGLPFLAAGVPNDQIDEDWIEINVFPTTNPSSIIGASYVMGSLAANNKAALELDFNQTGVDPCLVQVSVIHSLIT